MKRLISWLYKRYVLLPQIREKCGDDVDHIEIEFTPRIEIEFTPDEAFKAQIYKDITKQRVH